MTYPTTIPIDSIIIDPDRQRKDLGDLTDDTESILEVGLIEPIVLVFKSAGAVGGQGLEYADAYHLVAGERRLTICKNLGYKELTHGVTCMPGTPGYTCLEEVDTSTLQQIEFDENVRRKQLTWQERAVAIAKRHKQLKGEAAVKGQYWSNRETGKLLDVSEAHVDFVMLIAERLNAGDKEINACNSVYDGIKLLTKRREEETERHKMTLVPAQAPHIMPKVEGELSLPQSEKPSVEVWTHCHNMSFQAWASLNPDGIVNHIITDPPYAIDMDNIEQAGVGMKVGDVARTHDVMTNLNDMPLWMNECYRLLDKNGFCVWWCDMDNWSYILDLATLAGFAVQRWPITWVKTSPCQNGSAQYNFTKRTEIAMVMRKKGATLANIGAAVSNVWTGSASVEQAKFGHPFAKPLALHKFLFDAICVKGQTILDPFAGRGTLGVAAVEWGLTPINVEIETELHFPYLKQNIRQAYQNALGATNIVFKE